MKQRLSRKQNYMTDTTVTEIDLSATSSNMSLQRRFFPRRFFRKFFTIKKLFIAIILFVLLSVVRSNVQFYMTKSWVRLMVGMPTCHKDYTTENHPPSAQYWTKNLTLEKIVREYVSKEPYFKNKASKDFWNGYRSFCWGDKRDSYCLPSVYLAGWPKCATTALYMKLRRHNQIFSPQKETNFWNSLLFTNGMMTFDEYAKSYSDCSKRNFVVGLDASPMTIVQNLYLSKNVPKRIPSLGEQTKAAFANHEIIPPHIIVQITPQAKFIFLIREPGSRAYSQYLHSYRRIKYEVDSELEQGEHDDFHSPDEFHQLVVKQINSFNDCVKRKNAHQCVYDEKTVQVDHDSWLSLHMGLYAKFIKDLLKLVSWENILIIRYEDYMKNPSKHLGKALEFINILCDDDFVNKMNKDVYLHGFQEETEEIMKLKEWQRAKLREKDRISDVDRYPMWAKTRKLLTDFYEPYNRELSVLLTDDRYTFRDVL